LHTHCIDIINLIQDDFIPALELYIKHHQL